MIATRWLAPALVGTLILAGCAEQEAEPDAGMDAEAAAMESDAMDAEPVVDTTSADLATWNTDADARLAPDEFDSWLQEQDVYARWNSDGMDGLGAGEVAAGLVDVIDANDDGAIGLVEWEDGGAHWVGGDPAFEDVDSDADGSIGESEVAAALQDGTHWAAWDADGDGVLGEEEFRDAVFGAWDADGDGYVDETEWRANFDLW